MGQSSLDRILILGQLLILGQFLILVHIVIREDDSNVNIPILTGDQTVAAPVAVAAVCVLLLAAVLTVMGIRRYRKRSLTNQKHW